MLSVFFNGAGQFLINILPEGMKMDTDCFADNITDEMARFFYPQGRRSRKRTVMRHFDNAPIHCTGTVRDRIAAAELEGMEHSPDSPDLAPHYFFVFGSGNRKLIGKQYEMPEDLVSEVRNIIEEIRPDVLKSLFESWKVKLLDCWNYGNKYAE
jgi:hypothetical protein